MLFTCSIDQGREMPNEIIDYWMHFTDKERSLSCMTSNAGWMRNERLGEKENAPDHQCLPIVNEFSSLHFQLNDHVHRFPVLTTGQRSWPTMTSPLITVQKWTDVIVIRRSAPFFPVSILVSLSFSPVMFNSSGQVDVRLVLINGKRSISFLFSLVSATRIKSHRDWLRVIQMSIASSSSSSFHSVNIYLV